MRGSSVASRSSRASTTAAACVSRSWPRYLPCARNERSPGPALCSDATRFTATSGFPITSPPRRATISDSRTRPLLRGGPGLFQGLDHLVGDVQPRVPVHRLLENDVVLFRLGDLDDGAVGL